MRASDTVADSRPRGNGVNQMCFFSDLKSKPNPHARNAHKPPIALPPAFARISKRKALQKTLQKAHIRLSLVAHYSTL